MSHYIRVCSYGNYEFGYYQTPTGRCVDEYQVVARLWLREFNFLDERILSYEDSTREAIESLSFYVEEGYTFHNCYGKYIFSGGYQLVQSDSGIKPVMLSMV
ncbi:hypothetical protein ACFFHF_17165 [Robertmurraya beringensis]|uniref:LAGLIDADG homing endonuclease n=1 Tax=Robertmurraya beringensis TaxID=641660 RepID=A0ABV6KUC6_9BACI